MSINVLSFLRQRVTHLSSRKTTRQTASEGSASSRMKWPVLKSACGKGGRVSREMRGKEWAEEREG